MRLTLIAASSRSGRLLFFSSELLALGKIDHPDDPDVEYNGLAQVK